MTTKRRRRSPIVLITSLLLTSLALVSNAQPASAEQLTVTVELYRIEQVENPDSDGSQGDYFPTVKIGSGGEQSAGRIEDDAFDVDWVFSQTVEASGPTFIPVTIRLTDYDNFANGDDDIMDISPVDQDVDLTLTYDVYGQEWDGDATESAVWVEGDGDHDFPDDNDGRRARILFGITTSGAGDVDGDGIPNEVERGGIKRADGSVVWNQGLDPCRKTILLQADWMTGAADGHDHEPKDDAKDEVIASFDAAPVPAVDPCPFGGETRAQGVDFVFIPGTSIAEKPVMGLDDDFRAARRASFDRHLRPYAHYTIFVHDQKAGSSSSGLCCEGTQLGRDFIVSLGSWRLTCVIADDGTLNTTELEDDQRVGNEIRVGADRTCDTPAGPTDRQVVNVGQGADDASVGTVRDQSGTIMHELGHALGLGHGGDTGINFKPNYLSVMNYAFDPGGIPLDGAGNARLDYSRQALPKLDKTKLSESAGIGDGTDFTTWTDDAGMTRWGRGNVALNWSGNRTPAGLDIIDAGDVDVDVNARDDSGESETELTGFDDWSNIKYRASTASRNGGAHGHHGDPTFQDVLRREHELYAYFDPDIATTKTVDKPDAEPGETLAYTVKADNVGTGDAIAVSVTDTFPDGTTARRSVGTIAPGHHRNESFSYTIPCTTTDNTTLTNRATATATDLGNSPEVNTANNAGSASTVVHAPKLTLTETAPSTVVAGEAMAIELTVANVGTGTATNVVLTEVLAEDVYYSEGLDTGAGPKPTTAARNTDGTTVLTWLLGSLAGGGSTALSFTVRPSLLFLGGSTLSDQASVAYANASGCIFDPATASATTTVVEVAPTRNPLSAGYWKTHAADRVDELRARIQATDQRFDGADGSAPDGVLSDAEADAVLSAGGNQPEPLLVQELAVLFDLASRRINAGTRIDGRLASKLGTSNVRDAVLYAIATLAEPVSSASADRYSDATTILDLIANNKVERY